MEKCEERCPTCDEWATKYNQHTVYTNYIAVDQWAKYADLPLCTHCGAILVNGVWIYVCQKCGTKVEKLYGLFVPHNCLECDRAEVEAQKKRGAVCPNCRRVYSYCCC